MFRSVREYFQYQASEYGGAVTQSLIQAAKPGDAEAISIAQHFGAEVDRGIMHEYATWAALGEPIESCDVSAIIDRGIARGYATGAKAPAVVAAAEECRIAELAQPEKIPEVDQKFLSNQANYLIVGTIFFVVSLLILFSVPGSPIQIIGDGESAKNSEEKDPEKPHAFAVSARCFASIRETSVQVPSDGWSSDSGLHYADGNIRFNDLVGKTLTISQGVDGAVQNEGEQVREGKETLENTFNGLQLAMPVSESLYYSGPVGPAISYAFQLAVTNSAMGVGVGVANGMHEKSRKNGERFASLARQYDEAVRYVSGLQYNAR
ncbi:MAG: hypothetical protein K2Q25_06110 [Mycobacteriaceae bacterium]|nr:hypothetical protein [Mycobacteriaceae bacterium]